MQPTRAGVIINPISGRGGHRPGEAERRRAFVARETTAAGCAADIRVTTAGGQAAELARACVEAGCDVVIAMGGDGTVNEVAQALVGGVVPLGIVPCGSGDGLARGLGLPARRREALRVALGGETARIDVGYANDELFLNIAGIGFDAEVGHAFAGLSTRGALGYVTRTIRLVWTYQAVVYDADLDGRRRTGPKFLIGFANAPEYGNWAVLSPDADVRDGLLDAVLFDAGSPLGQMWRARRLFWNRRAPARGLERLRVRTAEVTGGRLVYHLDGEPRETSGPLRVRVAPRALPVRVRALRLP